jgi:hypothetical protein
MATTEQFLSSCCNAPFGVGGEGMTHWYLCTACGQPTHVPGDEEPSEVEMAALMMLNVDNPVEVPLDAV